MLRVRCNVYKMRSMVANTAHVNKVMNKLANKASLKMRSQFPLKFECL